MTDHVTKTGDATSKSRGPASGSNITDVAIIGGGVMGCALALRLAQRGLSVTVVERAIPGAEASSAAAGMLAPQMEAAGPGPMLELGLRSRALYPAFAAELRELTGIDVGYQQTGLLSLALTEAEAQAFDTQRAWQAARGLRLELLDGETARGLEPALGPTVRMALRFPDEAQVNARELAQALSQAAAAVGARFLQGRYVRRVLVEGGKAVGLALDGDVLSAGVVVVAAGSWSSLVEGAGVAADVVRPARGQLVSIETRPPMFRHLLSVPGRGYLVPRRDGTVIAGSTVEMAGFRKEVTVGGLATILGLATTIVPRLGEAPVTGHWSNFRPATPDHLPLLGPTAVRGLVLATGHYRNGILLTPVTAEAMADLIVNGDAGIDIGPFAVGRFAGAADR